MSPIGGEASRSAARKRSEIVTVLTPRGAVDVMQQEMRGLRKGSGWRTVLVRQTRREEGLG